MSGIAYCMVHGDHILGINAILKYAMRKCKNGKHLPVNFFEN